MIRMTKPYNIEEIIEKIVKKYYLVKYDKDNTISKTLSTSYDINKKYKEQIEINKKLKYN